MARFLDRVSIPDFVSWATGMRDYLQKEKLEEEKRNEEAMRRAAIAKLGYDMYNDRKQDEQDEQDARAVSDSIAKGSGRTKEERKASVAAEAATKAASKKASDSHKAASEPPPGLKDFNMRDDNPYAADAEKYELERELENIDPGAVNATYGKGSDKVKAFQRLIGTKDDGDFGKASRAAYDVWKRNRMMTRGY